MKPHATSDSRRRLAPGRRRLLIVLLLSGLLLAIGWAMTERAGAAPMPCTCTANGRTWPCAVQFMRIGVKWLPMRVCIKPQAGRVDGLAAPLPGNLGGCGRNNRNMRYGLTCDVSDAGRGFVSGECNGGYWFSRVATARTFDVGQVVTVNGCEGLNKELYAPIRISK